MGAYLIWVGILAVIWLALLIYRRDLTKEILFVSLLFMIFGLMNPFYVPEYWDPVSIYKIAGIFDIESFLFLFFTGGIASVIYEVVFGITHKKTKFKDSFRNKCRKRCNITIIGLFILFSVVSLAFIRIFTEVSALRISFILMVIAIIYILSSRPDLARESFIASVIFTTIYALSLIYVDSVYGFVQNEYNFAGSFGVFLFGLPIDEYIYAMFFAMIASVVYEQLRNIKLKRKNYK